MQLVQECLFNATLRLKTYFHCFDIIVAAVAFFLICLNQNTHKIQKKRQIFEMKNIDSFHLSFEMV